MGNEEMITIRSVQIESDPNRGNMVILKEQEEADSYFLMFIGDAEFGAIAKEKGMVEPKRPLTHDLYLSIIEHVQLEFLRIEIFEMRDDTYYARVIFLVNGEEQSADSRPSDAVALALSRKIPILVNQHLFRRKLTREEVKEFEGLVKSIKF